MRVMMLALLLAGCSEGGREAVFVEPGDESSPVLDAAQADQGKADTEPPGDAAQGVSTRTETVACDLVMDVVDYGQTRFAELPDGRLLHALLCDRTGAPEEPWACDTPGCATGYPGPDLKSACSLAQRVYRDGAQWVVECGSHMTVEATYLD